PAVGPGDDQKGVQLLHREHHAGGQAACAGGGGARRGYHPRVQGRLQDRVQRRARPRYLRHLADGCEWEGLEGPGGTETDQIEIYPSHILSREFTDPWDPWGVFV